MKRGLSRWVFGATGLALLTVGQVWAADISYTYKSLARLDEPLSTTGETPTRVWEIGGINQSGSVSGVTDYGNGESAFLINADGTAVILSKNESPAPAGGVWGGGINNKVAINDAGNCAWGQTVDRGDGAIDEVVFYDKTAKTYTSVARKGTAVTGGSLNSTVSLATLNNANDVVFTGALDAGTGTYIWDANTRQINPVCPPGTKLGNVAISNARRVQISQGARIVTFEGQVDGDGGYGAYMWKDGVITELARWGFSATDPSGKQTSESFTELRGPIANSNGDVAMNGQTASGWGAYLLTAVDKKLIRIAGPGDTVDGQKLTGVGSSYRNDIRIGEDGSVLFMAIFEDETRGLYLRQSDGTVTRVLKWGAEIAGLGKVTNTGGAIGGDAGLGLSLDGKIAVPVQIADDKWHLVLATPNKP